MTFKLKHFPFSHRYHAIDPYTVLLTPGFSVIWRKADNREVSDFQIKILSCLLTSHRSEMLLCKKATPWSNEHASE